jgi:ribosomal-protein-alanine N-acetyltransferase
MSEAVRAVVGYGFGEVGFNSIEAIVTPGNDPSVKLLEQNGFLREGHFRQNRFHNGAFLDTYIFSLRRCDWLNASR